MKVKKFTILNAKDNQSEAAQETDILINIDHIISVKPIKIVGKDNIIHGHWIRLSNGKKYRAIQIPSEFIELLYNGQIPANISLTDLDANIEVGNLTQ